jgi:hypothetical protein
MLFAAFIILFDSIFSPDLSAGEILSIHLLNCQIWRSKVIKTDKAVSFTGSVFWIPVDFCVDDHTKIAESLIKHLLVNLGIQITNKDVSANILSSLILGGLVDLDRLTEHFDHMHDLDRVISVILALELNKPIPLVIVGNLVSGEMDVNDGATLDKQLPE